MTFVAIRQTARYIETTFVALHVGSIKLINPVRVGQVVGVRLIRIRRIDGVRDVGQILSNTSGGITSFKFLEMLVVPALRSKCCVMRRLHLTCGQTGWAEVHAYQA
jgi:hypothetical protein